MKLLPSWLRGINVLLVFIPVSIALKLMHVGPLLIFGCAALAIVPLSSIMGQATEELSKRLGAQWGGLLNATFGNATELIIGILALRSGYIELVRASIIGSVLGNILLVFGCCAFFGGLKYKTQRFNEDLAQTNSITLLLAVVALTVPAVFLSTYHPVGPKPVNHVEDLSVAVAGLLLVFYVASLVFSLKTHESLFRSVEDGGDDPPVWSLRQSIIALAAASVVVAYESDLLVGSVKGATTAVGMNQVFVGIIIVPIIGNAAEHASAITMALKNKMDISINIALGSSAQVAMFVAPFLVLAGLFLHHHLTMVFPGSELLAIGLAVVSAAFIANDGKTHWLEGAQLLTAYAIVALAFFFIPG